MISSKITWRVLFLICLALFMFLILCEKVEVPSSAYKSQKDLLVYTSMYKYFLRTPTQLLIIIEKSVFEEKGKGIELI